ncbi:MAG: cupin domain-containing protein [Candidatus Omnitrophota bacterium]|nr:MAG: cupin domain-containing protein [Candidatus Omnitrophota bacterium]
MLIKRLKDCRQFLAGDNSILREYLNPGKEDLRINYSLAHATVRQGQVTKPHKLKSCEVYYILEGRGLMCIDAEEHQVGPLEVVYIPPGAVQYIKNTGSADLVFLCIVDPAWKAEDEQIM